MAIKSYILIELKKNGVREKSFWECQCLDIHIARALTALSLTLSMKIHVHLIVIQPAPFQHFIPTIFCTKLAMYIKNQIFNTKSYRNIFFILLLYYTLTENLYENALSEKVALFFKLENFVDKTTFNFHLFNKVNNFVKILQYFIHFV